MAQIFTEKIRVTGTPSEPWFVAKDVCEALGYKGTSILKHLNKSWMSMKKINTNRGIRDTRVLSEAAVHKLILCHEDPYIFNVSKWMTDDLIWTLVEEKKYKRIPDKFQESIVEIEALNKLIDTLREDSDSPPQQVEDRANVVWKEIIGYRLIPPLIK